MATEELYPYITPFCMNGGCEGVKKLNLNGTLLPSCNWRYELQFGKVVTCTHACHEITAGLAEMAAEMGKTYVAPRAPTVATPEVSAIAMTLGEIRRPAFQVTPSGRLAAGQLEQWLYDALKGQVMSATPDIADLSFEIQLAHPEYHPSAGALQAVLERWAAASYIKLSTKPIRVVGVYQGLHDSRTGPKFGPRRRLG